MKLLWDVPLTPEDRLPGPVDHTVLGGPLDGELLPEQFIGDPCLPVLHQSGRVTVTLRHAIDEDSGRHYYVPADLAGRLP